MKAFEPEPKIFKALMHPARLAILDELRSDEQCVCHLEAQLGLRQAYISQQLMVLRDAGLVADRRDGWNIFYRVSEPAIYHVLDAAGNIKGAQAAEPAQSRQKDKLPKKCPCPKCSPE